MNQSIKNVNSICRFCLNELDYQISDETQQTYSIYRNQQLFKLMVLFPTLEISDEKCDQCPKYLCKKCYQKCMEFDSLRKDVLKSSMVLLNFLDTKENSASGSISASTGAEMTLPEDNSQNRENIYSQENNNSIFEGICPIKTEVHCEDPAMQYVYHISTLEDEPQPAPKSIPIQNNKTSEVKRKSESHKEKPIPNLDLDFDSKAGTFKVFRCSLCGRQKKNAIYLEAHIRGVHQGATQPFQCKICPQAFTRYFRLDEHIKKRHTKEKGKHNCMTCGKNFLAKWDLRKHWERFPNCYNQPVKTS